MLVLSLVSCILIADVIAAGMYACGTANAAPAGTRGPMDLGQSFTFGTMRQSSAVGNGAVAPHSNESGRIEHNGR